MNFVLKKLGTLLLTLLILSFVAYAAFEMVGDPVNQILGTNASPEDVAALRESLGLNKPLLVRYLRWLTGFISGDLGDSYIYRIPVSGMIGDKLGVTVFLTLMGFALTLLFSVPLGVYGARREGSWADRLLTVVNQIVMAVPAFFVAILLMVLFGVVLRLFTPGSFVPFEESPGAFLLYMIFPALSIAVPRTAMTAKMLRSSILGEMQQDYVRTAYSRGHNRQSALKAHAFKNALLPVISFMASTMAEMLAGCIVIEQIFSIPGIGRLLMVSISNRDIPVVEAIVMILAVWVMLVHFLGEVVGEMLDPRRRA
ncbi:MAG: ABC transporter permease [Lachnospiraceae bacterium]|nr:ABC transporter permease [Lachnospiraceae bacterium]